MNVRTGAIARRKAATRERYVVNDDGAAPAQSGAVWDVFRVLAILDAYTLPALDQWPTATLLVTSINGLLAVCLWSGVVLVRLGWRALRAVSPLALFVVLLVAAPFRAIFGRSPPTRRKRRTWRRMLSL